MLTVDWHKIIPETYIYGAFGLVMTGLFTVARFMVKKAIEALKAEWQIVTARLERIENVQGVQAENHLNTIQANTAKTNEILDVNTAKTNEILNSMRLEQAETNGYLRAVTHGYLKDISGKNNEEKDS